MIKSYPSETKAESLIVAATNLDNLVIQIELTQGKIAIVNNVDADLAEFKWFAVKEGKYNKNYYAGRRNYSHGGRIHMHRVVLERVLGRPLKKDECTDHINHNGLDNRRSNLRVSSLRDNQRNKRILSKSKTGHGKGYYWNKKNRRWQAQIKLERGRTKYLGVFESEEDARLAYDKAARAYFGEYAYTNSDALREGIISHINIPKKEYGVLKPIEERIRIPPWKQKITQNKE